MLQPLALGACGDSTQCYLQGKPCLPDKSFCNASSDTEYVVRGSSAVRAHMPLVESKWYSHLFSLTPSHTHNSTPFLGFRVPSKWIKSTTPRTTSHGAYLASTRRYSNSSIADGDIVVLHSSCLRLQLSFLNPYWSVLYNTGTPEARKETLPPEQNRSMNASETCGAARPIMASTSSSQCQKRPTDVLKREQGYSVTRLGLFGRRRVLRYCLGTLRNSMLGKFTRKDKPNTVIKYVSILII